MRKSCLAAYKVRRRKRTRDGTLSLLATMITSTMPQNGDSTRVKLSHAVRIAVVVVSKYVSRDLGAVRADCTPTSLVPQAAMHWQKLPE